MTCAKLFFSANSYLSMMEVEKKPPYPWQAYLSSKCKIGEKRGDWSFYFVWIMAAK